MTERGSRTTPAGDTIPGAAPPTAPTPGSFLTPLVERARHREQDAFAAIYQARVRDVSRYVGSMVREPERVEDVVAQTFLLAWRDLPRLRAPERFDAWLFRIAHN